ncbi:hypothetical protein [uncultured Ferrimonas sp.]|uniref:hypothetical protein n=1 Tax=uncultured Ferrimonas sp. TaxID=432640 RepID=UPI002618F79C|nr:hypothetical protein [uncultured Ferrimonas sp.]
MGSIEVAVRQAKQIEAQLERHFGAEGRGLHEKLSSCESKLPSVLVRQIRWIATLRNKAVHEDGFELDDVAEFERRCTHVLQQLQQLKAPEPSVAASSAASAEASAKAWAAARGDTNPPRQPSKLKRVIGAVLLLLLLVVANNQWQQHQRAEARAEARYQARLDARVAAAKKAKAEKAEKAAQAARAAEAATANSNTNSNVALAAKPQGSNNGRVSVALNGGSLAEKAEQARNEVRDAKQQLQQQLQQTLVDGTQLTLGELAIKPNADGSVDLWLPLQWQSNPKALLAELNRYFWDYKKRTINGGKVDFSDHMGNDSVGIKILSMWNRKDNVKRPYSEDLFSWLTQHQVKLVASVAGKQGQIVLATGRRCSVSCSGVGDDQFQIHTSSSKNGPLIMRKDSNPLVIKSIPKAALLQAKQLQVQLVLSHNNNVVASSNQPLVRSLAAEEMNTLVGNSEQAFATGQQQITKLQQLMLNQTQLELGEIAIKPAKAGFSDVVVPLSWRMQHKPILAILNQYFHGYKGAAFRYSKVDFSDHMGSKSWGVKVVEYQNRDEAQKQPFSARLLQQLMQQQVVATVSIGNHQAQITLASGMRCSVSCSLGGDDQYHIQFQAKPGEKGRLSSYRENNPLVIKNVPNELLQQASSVDAALALVPLR